MRLEFIRQTSGKRHAWYKTDQGFLVRKPLTDAEAESFERITEVVHEEIKRVIKKRSIWQKIRDFFKRLYAR